MERQFILAVTFIFPVMILVTQRSELFISSLSTMLHCQPLLWWILLLVLSILPKNKELNREEDIKGLLEVTVMEG